MDNGNSAGFESEQDQKCIMFFPINSPGHINSGIALADELRYELGQRVVFVVTGKPLGTIEAHGHELIVIEESSEAEFYPLTDFEDPERNDLEAERRGEKKVKLARFEFWSQVITRNAHMMLVDPAEAISSYSILLESEMVNRTNEIQAQLSAIIQQLKPDLIVVDDYLISPCILTNPTIPWVRLWSANPFQQMKSKLENQVRPLHSCGFTIHDKQRRDHMRRHEPDQWRSLVAGWASHRQSVIDHIRRSQGPLASFLELNGCPPLPEGILSTHDSPHLNLLPYPLELGYQNEDDLFQLGARQLCVDSLIKLAPRPRGKDEKEQETQLEYWKQQFEEALAHKTKGSVLFSMGTIASGHVPLMKRFLGFLANDTDRLYVVSKGINGNHFELAPNMIGANHLPQRFFLERVDLALVHGGNNTFTECFYHGKPIIILPIFSDQLDNAQRLEDLGLAQRLDPHRCTGDQLIGAIDELLSNHQIIERCKRIGERMRSRKPTSTVARMLLKLAKDKKLSQEYIDQWRRDESSGVC